MIVKGVKISELELRDKLTGEEMIPFQDQLSNGKMDMKSIIGYFEEMSDQEVNLQSLVNIKQYVSNSKELEFISSNVGDVYFNTGDKKLYVYQEGGTWATTDPSKYRMYVRLDKDEYGRTNIIHRWDGNNMTVISERLFIGEEEGTAYEGSKGKQVRDDLDALNATIDKYPAKLVSGILDPNYSGSSVDLRYSFYDRISDTNSTGTKTVNCASQSNAGFMAAADKVKLDVTLPNDIKAEEDARKAADSTLQGNIDSSNSDLNSKITAETERATQAENTITTNYKAADTTLQSNINNEATTRSEADAALDSKISKEVSDRTQAISTLQGSLDTEIARATKAEQDITSAYEAADTTLQNNINAINNSKGVANGIATLDQNGLVPSSQLPSYVDDVIEVSTFSALPETGESGKIYITQDTNLTYRWSGTAYVEISQSLALGETSSTAYAGDKGKATTDKLNRIPNKLIIDTNGVTYNDPDSVVLKYTFYKQQEQETSTNIHIINAATTATPGIMTAADKTKLNKVLTNGDGSKYLSDNGVYNTIVADTAETVKTTEVIPVAGGPLATLLNNAGITTISTDTSMQDLFMQLFTKELWPTNLTFKEGTITTSISAPTMTLSNSGLVEVGTTITVSGISIAATSRNTTNRTYSGFTYGYSSANDNTRDNSSTSITISAQNIASNNDPYSLKRTINGNAVSANANADYTQVTLDSTTFNAIEGTNTVKAETTGTKYHCTFGTIPVYYACSNLGKTSEDHKSIAKDAATVTSGIPSNSKSLTVTGVYPYYTNKDNITTFAKLALTSNKTLDITYVAETASNKHAFKLPAKFNVSSVTLLNTLSGNYEDYDISKFTVTTENIDVQGTSVSYKVYTRNDGTNGSSSFKITFA